MRSMAPLALVLLAAAAPAEPPAVTSAYTKLDLDKCTPLNDTEGLGWMEWQCEGHSGRTLFVQNGDDRYDLDAGVRDEDALWAATFDYPGDTIEWRLRDGTPFAIIYRLRNANPDRPASSKLMVETLGDKGKSGCRIAEIDGASPDANILARRAADSLLVEPASCLKAE